MTFLPIIILDTLAFILAASVHELMHGYVAHLLGDDTAKRAGRLTLNPVVHIDPVGTLLLPLILKLSGASMIFGWAKPVPFNPYNLRWPRVGPFLVAVAGPLSNMIMFVLALMLHAALLPSLGAENLLSVFLLLFAMVNVALAVFNILPIPPLDGSKLFYLFHETSAIRNIVHAIEQNGFFIVLIYMVMGAPGLLWLYRQVVALGFVLAGV